MARWHGNHQWIAPCRFGRDAFAYLIGLGETHVVQVVVQPLDLLRQRHLEQTDISLGFFLPTHGQQSRQARRRDAVG